MLRPISPNISIITNFGCRANCWYCIWKNHPLKHVNDQMDWNKLEDFLTFYKDKGKVSISGGGDCLYRYDIYYSWWERLFSITHKLSIKVDIHTKEKFVDTDFWNKINKCVFSSNILKNDIEYLEYIANLVLLRIVHLVTEYTTNDIIEEYLLFQKKTKCQFTIKELIGFDDKGRYKQIKEKYPSIYYLDAGDYNIYYMPDNTIKDKFLW